jgi:hypothetical protein
MNWSSALATPTELNPIVRNIQPTNRLNQRELQVPAIARTHSKITEREACLIIASSNAFFQEAIWSNSKCHLPLRAPKFPLAGIQFPMRCIDLSFAQTFEIAGERTSAWHSKGRKYAKIPDNVDFIGNFGNEISHDECVRARSIQRVQRGDISLH